MFKSSVAAAALLALSAGGASAAILYGTTGSGGTLSDLISIDISTGTTTLIGPVGYAVNGLTYDNSTGTLYGSAAFDVGLLTIDTSTGAGTLVGPFNSPAGGCSDRNVLLTANSAGNLFGWCDPSSDDLMSIDKNTGQASIVGESSIGTAAHGLAFDNGNDLYLYNTGGAVYGIDPATGAAAFLGSPTNAGGLAHHGDFNPDNNYYYGMPSLPLSGSIDIYDLAGSFSYVSSIALDRSDVFTLAFTGANTAVPEPESLAIFGFGLAGLGFLRRRRNTPAA